eukprot:CAMPEP_0173440416 /NCGR_PEP_ID=MMETSP1357-20121228/22829_1 /TAXON_ID=77926 /ORGANISM="Hemiselmis rufescens, Strain PCC563" /LENGTH=74 /DNA_ID=CAMNT_0014405893 /DNA_START=15 /DNA_END=239 /DNA_ORIENTATION=+
MADAEFVPEPSVSPHLIILLVVGFLFTAVFGGAVGLWFWVQKNADQLPLKKKKKPLTAKQLAKQRVRETQSGGD